VTIVAGIGGVDSPRRVGRVGRVGLRSPLCFHACTLAALAVGLIAVNVFQPGAGVHAHPGELHLSGDAAGPPRNHHTTREPNGHSPTHDPEAAPRR
jgi:aerobic C4-dicarboxylate transport protein